MPKFRYGSICVWGPGHPFEWHRSAVRVLLRWTEYTDAIYYTLSKTVSDMQCEARLSENHEPDLECWPSRSLLAGDAMSKIYLGSKQGDSQRPSCPRGSSPAPNSLCIKYTKYAYLHTQSTADT